MCTSKGITKLGSVGGAYGMFLGSFKGGRNEGLMYGMDKGSWYD